MSLVEHLLDTRTPLELAKMLAAEARDNARLKDQVGHLERELFWMRVEENEELENLKMDKIWNEAVADAALAAIDAAPPAPQAAQPVENIDTPEFRILLSSVSVENRLGDPTEKFQIMLDRLIAHINERMHEYGYAQFNAGKVAARADNDALLRQCMNLGKRAETAEKLLAQYTELLALKENQMDALRTQLAARPAVDLSDEQIMRVAGDVRQRNSGAWPGDVAFVRALLAQDKPAAPACYCGTCEPYDPLNGRMILCAGQVAGRCCRPRRADHAGVTWAGRKLLTPPPLAPRSTSNQTPLAAGRSFTNLPTLMTPLLALRALTFWPSLKAGLIAAAMCFLSMVGYWPLTAASRHGASATRAFQIPLGAAWFAWPGLAGWLQHPATACFIR